MKRISLVALGVVLLGAPAPGGAEPRDSTPERVSIVAAVGALRPAGRFGDVADGGLLTGFEGFFRLTEYLAPAFAVHYGLLEPSGRRGSLDTWSVLGGLRVFVLPSRQWVRPWVTALGGWGHYSLSPRIPLEPVFGQRRDDRDDAQLLAGGGFDFRIHPNFELGVALRHHVSFTDDSDTDERDLHAFSVLGSLVFNY